MLDLSVGPLWWLDDGAPRSPAPAPLCSAELIAGKPCTAAALIGDCLSATADGGNSVATSRRPKGPSGPFFEIVAAATPFPMLTATGEDEVDSVRCCCPFTRREKPWSARATASVVSKKIKVASPAADLRYSGGNRGRLRTFSGANSV